MKVHDSEPCIKYSLEISRPYKAVRQIISENNISSVADIYALLKDSFKDILQELMEADWMPHLDMRKIKKGSCLLTTREMDILQRLSKASMENSR